MIQLIIFYGMFAVLLVLVGLSLRESVIRTSRTMAALIDASRVSTDAARKSAEAAAKLAEMLEKEHHA